MPSLCGTLISAHGRVLCSAILGIVFMACMLPVPGYLAKSVEGVQAEKMKRVRFLLMYLLTVHVTHIHM